MSSIDPAAMPAPPRAGERRRRRGVIAFAASALLLLLVALLPTPYVIQVPGPVFDTLGTTDHDGDERPLISIEGAETFETDGALDLLTVSVLGNPDQRPSWAEVAVAWFDRTRSVVPIEAVFPADQTLEEREEQNAALMVDSQQDAIAAALLAEGIDVGATLTVASVAPESPAEGILEPDDVILEVAGERPDTVQQIRAAFADAGAGTPVPVEIERGGEREAFDLTPEVLAGSGEAPVVGIGVGAEYDFPFDVTIELDDVGGPSAGMMFALGIIDKLTPGSLTGDTHVAGTGTIDAAGSVGAIGGIRQKLYGATDAGAEVFLAPASNCDEVVGHIPDGLDVYSVDTLDDATAVLDAIATDAPTGELARCESE